MNCNVISNMQDNWYATPKGVSTHRLRTTDVNILDLNIFVCVCVHVCMWRRACAHVLVEARLSLRSSSDVVFSFPMGPLSGLELAMWYRLARPERTTCLHLPVLGLQEYSTPPHLPPFLFYFHFYYFCTGSGNQTQVSVFPRQTLYQLNYLPSPCLRILFINQYR